ncbi:MAG TPA: PASTA domain-containing protein [Longimicrobiaceae bacterium]|nr:PASTA domain-containing protein [Longimicrobiaceae bacterium]
MRHGTLRRIVVVAVGGFALGFVSVALYLRFGVTRRDVATVPDVRHLGAGAARRALQRADLRLTIGDSLANSSVPAGAVVAQSPLPGREVGPGSEVRVFLSTGPVREPVPDVGLLPAAQAVRILEATGFQVHLDTARDARAAGRVVGTDPAAGTFVGVPGVVRLIISAGPPRVEVPVLAGALQPQARALLDAAGLRLGEVGVQFREDLPEGEVVTQSVAPGDSLVAGTRVDIVVATHQLLGSPVPTGQQDAAGGL